MNYGGGGALLSGGSSIMENCTVASNYDASNCGGGVQIYDGGVCLNSIIYLNQDAAMDAKTNWGVGNNNGQFAYCSTAPAISVTYDGGGNITADPLFANPMQGNYRLTANSPCVNAGSNSAWMTGAKDLDGRPRIGILNSRVDMGAWEE